MGERKESSPLDVSLLGDHSEFMSGGPQCGPSNRMDGDDFQAFPWWKLLGIPACNMDNSCTFNTEVLVMVDRPSKVRVTILIVNPTD